MLLDQPLRGGYESYVPVFQHGLQKKTNFRLHHPKLAKVPMRMVEEWVKLNYLTL
jgi:hypothetical protein